MPSEKNMLKFNQPMKSDEMPYIICVDHESLIKKIGGCKNNPDESWTLRIGGDHIPCGNSMSTIWRFDHIKNMHALYQGKNFMKKFCSSLREQAKTIMIFKNKIKKIPLTNKQLKSHEDAIVCYICGKYLLKELFRDIIHQIARDHCQYMRKYRGQHTAFVI